MRQPDSWAPQWETYAMPRGRGRWWLLVAGSFLIVVASWVLPHDTTPGAGLSLRSWLTLGMAVVVVILLNSYRAAGARPLLRAAAEYAVVAALAVLLTITSGVGAAGHHQAAGADQRPAVIRRAADAYGFVVGLWHQAQGKANADRQAPTTTRPRGRHR
jgi:hypothetical protein